MIYLNLLRVQSFFFGSKRNRVHDNRHSRIQATVQAAAFVIYNDGVA